MATLLRRIQKLRAFRTATQLLKRGEAGLGSLQVVMILAIAAVCLLAIKQWWIPISQYFNGLFEILLFE